MHKNYSYRLYPTRRQTTILSAQLETCRKAYNQLLEDRKTSYEATGTAPSLYDQITKLKELKYSNPELGLRDVHSQVLQNVAVRVDLAFKAYFRRVKAKEKEVGYPRFKGFGRYDSITFPQAQTGGCWISPEGRVVVSKVGHIKAKIHRSLEGKVKTATIKRTSTGKWFVVFSCEDVPSKPLPKLDTEVGVDLGVRKFATFSDGFVIENPRHLDQDKRDLARVQRKLSKAKKGTLERTFRRKAVSRVHERIKNRRDDFTSKLAKQVCEKYGVVYLEDLTINRMGRSRAERRNIRDAAWSCFVSKLEVKAVDAGRQVVLVNPAYTSRTCSKCGYRMPEELKGNVFKCPDCGYSEDRDLNASFNILTLGQQSQAVLPSRSRRL